MAKTNLLLAATLLLCFIVITSFARPDPNLYSQVLTQLDRFSHLSFFIYI